MNAEARICPTCGSNVKGRADKRFCNDYCRNNYNNQLNSDSINYVRNVNNILRRNRRILEETMEGVEKATARSKAELAKKGYRFDFFTSIFTNKEKETYYYCYDYGYKEIEQEKCIIVRKKTSRFAEPGNKI